MKTIGIVPARMAASRFPGKPLHPIAGRPMLEHCYLRPMLMFTARPHQLRQHNQAQVFSHLSTWTQKARVRGDSLQDCVFLFNPTRDAPPAYRELCEDAAGWLGIDSQALCNHLEEKLKQGRNHKDKEEVSIGLLTHLHTSWSTMMQRHSVRVERDDDLLLSLGLFSTHYFISDGLPFSDFMRQENIGGIDAIELTANLGVRKRFDPNRDGWSQASHADVRDRENRDHKPDGVLVEAISYENSDKPAGSSQSTQTYRFYRAKMVNSSDRGYCIEWPSNEAVKLNTGDVVGVREEAEYTWSVGVIRWVKQVDEHSNQLGLEVLSTTADAYSARKVRAGLATGEYQRALMLPPDRDSGLPQRILVQRSAFAEGDSAELNSPGQTYRVKLQTCLVNTASLGLYEFSAMVKADHNDGDNHHGNSLSELPLPEVEESPQAETNKRKQEFDNLWEDL